MSDTWPPMEQWAARLPDEEPQRCIAHTKLYEKHNDRLKEKLEREERLGRYTLADGEKFESPQRQELSEVLAKLRARVKR